MSGYLPGDKAGLLLSSAIHDLECSASPSPPTPKLYDGLTAEQCLDLFIAEQRGERCPSLKSDGHCASCRLSPVQVQAARALWSAQLRAKVEASKTAAKAREVSVVVDLEDL